MPTVILYRVVQVELCAVECLILAFCINFVFHESQSTGDPYIASFTSFLSARNIHYNQLHHPSTLHNRSKWIHAKYYIWYRILVTGMPFAFIESIQWWYCVCTVIPLFNRIACAMASKFSERLSPNFMYYEQVWTKPLWPEHKVKASQFRNRNEGKIKYVVTPSTIVSEYWSIRPLTPLCVYVMRWI